MEEALLDDQAAGDDLLADVVAQAVDRAIGVPGDVGEQLQRMAAGRVAEEFFFVAQALEAGGFGQRDGGEAVQVAGRQEPELGIYDLRFTIYERGLLLRSARCGRLAKT